jgi:hypothetical protein
MLGGDSELCVNESILCMLYFLEIEVSPWGAISERTRKPKANNGQTCFSTVYPLRGHAHARIEQWRCGINITYSIQHTPSRLDAH